MCLHMTGTCQIKAATLESLSMWASNAPCRQGQAKTPVLGGEMTVALAGIQLACIDDLCSWLRVARIPSKWRAVAHHAACKGSEFACIVLHHCGQHASTSACYTILPYSPPTLTSALTDAFVLAHMNAIFGVQIGRIGGVGGHAVFDNSYFKNILASSVGLGSDKQLVMDPETLPIVKDLAANNQKFLNEFRAAYIKMMNFV
jgi:hypothetical protein